MQSNRQPHLFVDNEIEYFIPALYGGQNTWDEQFGPLNLTYRFAIPKQFASQNNAEMLNNEYQHIFQDAMSGFSAVANVNFVPKRTGLPMLQIFADYSMEYEGKALRRLNQEIHTFINSSLIISLERLNRETQPSFRNWGFRSIAIHELGHILGLEHGFEHDIVFNKLRILPSEEHSCLYSMMNYNLGRFSYRHHPTEVITISPTPYDIAALQYIYGPNLKTNSGDTLYHLRTLSQPYTNSPRLILNTYWDSNGVDTLDGEGCVEPHLSIAEGPYAISSCGKGLTMFAYGSNIENVRGSRTSNTIELNRRNNIVDVRESRYSEIKTTPVSSGKDIVLGFVPGRDKIIIEIPPNTPEPQFQILSLAPRVIRFNNTRIKMDAGVSIKFSEDDMLSLPGVDMNECTRNQVVYQTNPRLALKSDSFNPRRYRYDSAPANPSTAPVNSAAPPSSMQLAVNSTLNRPTPVRDELEDPTYFLDLAWSAFKTGALLTFIETLGCDTLDIIAKRYNWPKENLELVKQTLQMMVRLATGSAWSCAAAYCGHNIAANLPFFNRYASWIGRACGVGVTAASMPANLTRFAIGAAAGFAGSAAGFWFEKKLMKTIQLHQPMPAAPPHAKR